MNAFLTVLCAACAVLATALATAPALAQSLGNTPSVAAPNKAATGAAASPVRPAGEYRNTSWEDLTPKDWDPMKEFKDLRLSPLGDSDPRAQAMLGRLREAWANAPTNNALEGVAVRIPGYLVPLEDSKAGMKEFLLVPYFGACIHTPPPPANQIIHVLPKVPAAGVRSMDTVWVSGTLKSFRSDTNMGVSGYRMEATKVEPYSPQAR